MADSIAIRAVAQAIAELNADLPPGIPETTNRRVFPGDKIPLEQLRMAVFLGDESLDAPMQSSNQDRIARRRTAIAVQCAASTTDVALIDTIVDPLLNHATARLGQSRLGGLVHYIRETGTNRRSEYKDLYLSICTRIFEISYQTRRNDSTTNA